jgi:hypothetical protein
MQDAWLDFSRSRMRSEKRSVPTNRRPQQSNGAGGVRKEEKFNLNRFA